MIIQGLEGDEIQSIDFFTDLYIVFEFFKMFHSLLNVSQEACAIIFRRFNCIGLQY